MASVDPHLMSACDVSINVDATLLTQLEHVQKMFIRRLLGVAKRSPVATLFSETGMWPIKYRRIMLALRYWQYALSLPNDHLLSYAFADSMTLARTRKASWIGDLARVCAALPHPVRIDLLRRWSPVDIDNVIAAIEKSCLRDIDSFLASSAKTPLLRHRSDCTPLDYDVPLQKARVSSFRSYLNLVPIPAHRKAVVRLLTSSHTLAIEVYRWSGRRRPPIPRAQRLRRYCQTEVEDEIHVLLYCDALESLQDLRREFFSNIFALSACTLVTALRLAPSGLDIVRTFVDADDAGILCCFAKYVYDISHVYNEAPLYCP